MSFRVNDGSRIGEQHATFNGMEGAGCGPVQQGGEHDRRMAVHEQLAPGVWGCLFLVFFSSSLLVLPK